MKKLLMIATVAVFSITSITAQNFNVGVNVGLPLENGQDLFSLNAGLDANYLWEVSDKFDLGVSTGYSQFFGASINAVSVIGVSSIEVKDFSFIPVAVAGRFDLTEDFTLGLDLGYAQVINSGNADGGLYYAPKVQYGITNSMDLVLSYKALRRIGASALSSLSLGVEFGL